MKKLILLFAFGIVFTNAQNTEESETFDKKNEIAFNAFDLVVAGSLDLRYERMLKNNQSVAFSVALFDNFSYYDVGWDGYKSNAYSFQAAYLIYFSKRKLYKGFFFYPYMKFRTGNIEYKDYYYYNDDTYTTVKHDVGGFQVGFGLGNKWRIANDRVSLGLGLELGRELGGKIDTDYFSKVEFRLGVNLGFVF